LIVPNAELPPAIPFTFQLTVVFDVLLTVAEKAWLAPTATVAFGGATATVIAGGAVIVSVDDAERAGSATELAVTVTVAGDGTVAGAE
jgi:hypothetical protein